MASLIVRSLPYVIGGAIGVLASVLLPHTAGEEKPAPPVTYPDFSVEWRSAPSDSWAEHRVIVLPTGERVFVTSYSFHNRAAVLLPPLPKPIEKVDPPAIESAVDLGGSRASAKD